MEREWLTLKEQLSTIRHYIAEAYFLIPIENSLPISTEHAIFQVFDGIDKVIKIADSYILSTKDYNEKYCYGGTSDGLDDHTSQWGGEQGQTVCPCQGEPGQRWAHLKLCGRFFINTLTLQEPPEMVHGNKRKDRPLN